MKLCNGFADDPDVLGMFNIIMYIYYTVYTVCPKNKTLAV